MASALYSKQATRKLWDDLLESKKRLTTWCRSNRVNRQEIVLSVQKHFPLEWQDKEHLLGAIPTAICEYCGLEFIINVAGQRFCNAGEARKNWDVVNPGYSSARRSVKSRNGKKTTAS